MSGVKYEGALFLKETVKAELLRAHPAGGWLDPESREVEDLITNNGRIFLAKRIASGDSVASAMAYMAVGTATAVATLNDTALGGEVDRKTLAVNSATANNIYTAIATWGGAADSVTSVQITEAGVLNAAAAGTLFQRVTFAAVTLAQSDLLKVTLQTTVGSNTI